MPAQELKRATGQQPLASDEMLPFTALNVYSKLSKKTCTYRVVTGVYNPISSVPHPITFDRWEELVEYRDGDVCRRTSLKQILEQTQSAWDQMKRKGHHIHPPPTPFLRKVALSNAGEARLLLEQLGL